MNLITITSPFLYILHVSTSLKTPSSAPQTFVITHWRTLSPSVFITSVKIVPSPLLILRLNFGIHPSPPFPGELDSGHCYFREAVPQFCLSQRNRCGKAAKKRNSQDRGGNSHGQFDFWKHRTKITRVGRVNNYKNRTLIRSTKDNALAAVLLTNKYEHTGKGI